MDRDRNSRRKKDSVFKNVMISLGCGVFAAVYFTGICFVVQIFASVNNKSDMPAWLERVEIHVEDERSLSNGNDNEPIKSGTVEVQPETEIQIEIEENTFTQDDEQPDDIGQKQRFNNEEDKKDSENKVESQISTKEEKDQTQEIQTEEVGTEEKAQETKESQETQTEEVGTEETQTEENTQETEEESQETQTEEVGTEETQTEENTQETEEESQETQTEETKQKTSLVVENVELEQSTEDGVTILPNVTSIVKAVMPCVVSVRNEFTTYDYWYDEMVDDEACASGIIVAQNNDELMIVTNYHVVEDSNSLYITFIDNSEVPAYVKGASPNEDIAVISVDMREIADETVDRIAIAKLGDSESLEVGEPAIAIGNALGYGQSVTTGIISAFNTNIFKEEEEAENETESGTSWLIQTDAAINPGNSGGALLNAKGEVIGICQGKIADYVIEGMGYAIPISTAEPVINDLMKKETRKKVPVEEKGFLGIAGTDVSEDATEKYDMPEGVYVSEVIKDTAADKAGILKGDIIISLDKEKTIHMKEIQNMLEYYSAGTQIEIVVMRRINGEYTEKTFDVILQSKN